MKTKLVASGLSYAALRKECFDAVRQWPGCETISGIQIIRQNNGSFSLRVTLYGSADRRRADRAMCAVEREKRRHFCLVDNDARCEQHCPRSGAGSAVGS
jgi:hypothetical protein